MGCLEKDNGWKCLKREAGFLLPAFRGGIKMFNTGAMQANETYTINLESLSTYYYSAGQTVRPISIAQKYTGQNRHCLLNIAQNNIYYIHKDSQVDDWYQVSVDSEGVLTFTAKQYAQYGFIISI